MEKETIKLSVFTRLLGYALADKKQLGIALGLLFLASVTDVSGPWLIQHFIDNNIAKGQLSYF